MRGIKKICCVTSLDSNSVTFVLNHANIGANCPSILILRRMVKSASQYNLSFSSYDWFVTSRWVFVFLLVIRPKLVVQKAGFQGPIPSQSGRKQFQGRGGVPEKHYKKQLPISNGQTPSLNLVSMVRGSDYCRISATLALKGLIEIVGKIQNCVSGFFRGQ